MREILFRGKRTDTGEWVYGSFCPDACELMGQRGGQLLDGFIRNYDEAAGKMQMHEVERKTVGQFTGLTDKNGKRIFEGDIIKHFNGTSTGYDAGYIFWDSDKLQWRRTTSNLTQSGTVKDYRLGEDCVYEVIGNIHDNPELLAGGA